MDYVRNGMYNTVLRILLLVPRGVWKRQTLSRIVSGNCEKNMFSINNIMIYCVDLINNFSVLTISKSDVSFKKVRLIIVVDDPLCSI